MHVVYTQITWELGRNPGSGSAGGQLIPVLSPTLILMLVPLCSSVAIPLQVRTYDDGYAVEDRVVECFANFSGAVSQWTDEADYLSTLVSPLPVE